ncbi:unnamed protein product [Urochloa humidicola]
MGGENPSGQSPQSGVGSWPRAAAASGIMHRHDSRRRAPKHHRESTAAAAASIRGSVRRRIRSHVHRPRRFSQFDRFSGGMS